MASGVSPHQRRNQASRVKHSEQDPRIVQLRPGLFSPEEEKVSLLKLVVSALLRSRRTETFDRGGTYRLSIASIRQLSSLIKCSYRQGRLIRQGGITEVNEYNWSAFDPTEAFHILFKQEHFHLLTTLYSVPLRRVVVQKGLALAFSSLSCIARKMVRSSGSIDSGGCLNCCAKFMMRLERLDAPGIKRHGVWGLPSDVAEVTPFPTPRPQEQMSSTYLSRGISRLPADSNDDFYNPIQQCSQGFALIPPQAHCAYDAPKSRDKTCSGGAWAIAIGAILSSSMVSDITTALRLTSSIIDTLPTSEFGQASVDFQKAVDETRAAWPDIFECSGKYPNFVSFNLVVLIYPCLSCTRILHDV